MKYQLLLEQDVEHLGRKGDIVEVKGGYARNFLLPKRKAVVATKAMLRRQKKLQEERAVQAQKDLEEALSLKGRLEGANLSAIAKVDPDGNMYGSISAHDIIVLLEEQTGVVLERKNILLKHPLRVLGGHKISLKLKEDVSLEISLTISPDHPIPTLKEEPKEVVASEETEEAAPQE